MLHKSGQKLLILETMCIGNDSLNKTCQAHSSPAGYKSWHYLINIIFFVSVFMPFTSGE
jgi:hypothetical protein